MTRVRQQIHSRGEESFRVTLEQSGLRLHLAHLAPKMTVPAGQHRTVLYIHGATFPIALSIGFRFNGHSWMDDLAEAGFDVWGLDFLGYGGSDRYLEMEAPPETNPPLGRAAEAARQIAKAVEFIAEHQGTQHVSLLAHSRGTLPAGLYATTHPERLDRLVLFGPVALRRQEQSPKGRPPAYKDVTVEEQWQRFTGYLPSGESPVLGKHHFDLWGLAYLASDPTSETRTPSSVRVPNGFEADFTDAWNGHFTYDPGKVQTPTLIVRGEWDSITTDADARWLWEALGSVPLKREVLISRGTHVCHLEASRFQLYREVETFLKGHDSAQPKGVAQ